tara:strand:+ start:231 stop:638 length:408 start_codon:yes stop_codon:yes gene_type:complete
MENRIRDKIKEIEKYLYELSEIKPNNIEEYLDDFKTKAACERYFEKIMESVVDLAFLVIKNKSFATPEDDKKAFEILENEGIITNELSEKLKDAKGMRNIIAHEYGNVDDNIMFESITEQIENDVKEFIDNIKKL